MIAASDEDTGYEKVCLIFHPRRKITCFRLGFFDEKIKGFDKSIFIPREANGLDAYTVGIWFSKYQPAVAGFWHFKIAVIHRSLFLVFPNDSSNNINMALKIAETLHS